MVFFALGMLLYASAPTAGASGSLALFVGIYCVILTMYGGGFATIPAYLADSFGVGNVSAIHGRLLTAWSTAGVLGPQLVNYIREFQIGRGVAASDAYTFTMYILVAFLGVGLICNLAVRPVANSLFTLAPAAPKRSGGAAAVDDAGRRVGSRRDRLAARGHSDRLGRLQDADAGEPDVSMNWVIRRIGDLVNVNRHEIDRTIVESPDAAGGACWPVARDGLRRDARSGSTIRRPAFRGCRTARRTSRRRRRASRTASPTCPASGRCRASSS